MTTLKTMTIAAVLLAGGTSLATAQYGYPGYGYGYGYAGAPLYDYAGAYGAPATAGTTVIIVTPGAPTYTAPPVVGSRYYNYAPGYWGGGYGRAGYWGGYGYGWR
jgi:hypothetical protein